MRSFLLLLLTLLPCLAQEPLLDPNKLVGEHTCRGSNASGTAYEGTVRIRVKNGLVLMEWNIKGQKSYGTGLVEGMGLGVGLENGVALYTVFPQTDGFTLIGLWATQGASAAGEEKIFIGNTDIENVAIPVESINGSYRLSQKTTALISGGDTIKKIKLQTGGQSADAEGLLLGSNLAVITPTGLSVFEMNTEKGATSFIGRSVDSSGVVSKTSLTPLE